jgi:hypothetical protein
MKRLTKQGILNIFNENTKNVYKKKGRFLFRKANPGETILTIVAGQLETIKTTVEGDIILRNIEIGSSAETYVISDVKFIERYSRPTTKPEPYYIIDGIWWGEAYAKGSIEAFEYHGEDIVFEAPWGVDMMCVYGDYIARPVGGDIDDIYRIERKTFEKTYVLEGNK